MLIPLVGFVQGDSLGLVLLVQDGETLGEVAAKLLQAASVRVVPFAPVAVLHGGEPLSLTTTVSRAALRPMDRIDVVRALAAETAGALGGP